MTWFEIYMQARTETKEVVPVAWLNSVIAMQWMSTAQFILQQETSACWRTATIGLVANNTNGIYDLPAGFRQFNEVTWSLTTDTPDFVTVFVRAYQDLHRVAASNRTSINDPIPPSNDYLQGKIFVAVTPRKELLVYPFDLSTGYLTINYAPYLNPYSPTDKDEWAGYGADPTNKMQSCGPEDCFTAATHGIKEYVKAQIFAGSPGGLKVHRDEYDLAMSQFQAAISAAKTDQTDYTQMTLPPPNLAGLF